MADEVLLQVSYAIGVADPINIFVNTYGTSHVDMTDSEIAARLATLVDLRPRSIEKELGLRAPIYKETAAYGHMGRKTRIVEKTFESRYEEGHPIKMTVKLFPWEELNLVEKFSKAFGTGK